MLKGFEKQVRFVSVKAEHPNHHVMPSHVKGLGGGQPCGETETHEANFSPRTCVAIHIMH